MLPEKIERVVIWHGKVDFRKQWNGLLAMCRHLGFDPYEGDLVVFIKKDRTQIRALCGDAVGLFLHCRRFEGGAIKYLVSKDLEYITRAELGLWFLGHTFVVQRKAKPWNNR